MRDWLLELSKKERTSLHDLEYLLGRKVEDRTEYDQIMEVIKSPDNLAMGRVEFYRKFPQMEAYRLQKKEREETSITERNQGNVILSVGCSHAF